MMHHKLLFGLLLAGCISTDPPKGDTVGPSNRLIEVAGEDILIMGDTGSGDPIQYKVGVAAAAFCASHSCDFGLLLGDNFYPKGVASPLDSQWASKLELPYALLPKSLVFYPTLGNHDYDGNWSAEVAYKSPRWSMPNRYYKIVTPKAEIYCIDSEHFDDAQKAWLLSGLKARTRQWTIVYGHRPLYSSGQHIKSPQLQKYIQKMLLTFRVDFYLAGHDHHLELIEIGNFVQIVSGSAGKLRALGAKAKGQKFVRVTNGFTHMDFTDAGVQVSFIDSDNRTLFTLGYKNKGKSTP